MSLNYDFKRCKFCGETAAEPLYRLDGGKIIYRCTACDFHAIAFLDLPAGNSSPDMGTPLDETSRAYMEERLRGFDPLPALRLELIKRHVGLEGASCLDIGAGVGQFVVLLAGEGAVVHGLEPSRMRREFARLKFGLDLFPHTIEQFGRQEENAGRFDVATLWDVVEHVNYPVETMEAVQRVLKPGGMLFIDTPSREAVSYRFSERLYRLTGGKVSLYLNSFYSAAPFGHKQIFRPGQLAQLARNTGFDVVSLKYGYEDRAGLSTMVRPRNRLVLVCRRL
ncbi:MAG: class I SAM-dependent methyltransferase [Geoalkalibacter sp.]|jgi:2-polyprenyl-6-hydroxyphenyl methylase/3-demethylubiquinone-9 3-methyltransferase|uniref:class I SAM-dependent methyltransferase n=1 Tax=Geoalkalibacter sp. TaxID=3041440 RepID=UPI002A9BF1BB|nr:class I SAM-dependent methyltransferase [Thermodesulfobacteriota bacterium]